MSISTVMVDAVDARRARLFELVGDHPDFRVVGEARTVREAVVVLSRLQPDLIIAVSDTLEVDSCPGPMSLLQATEHSTFIFIGDCPVPTFKYLTTNVFLLDLAELNSAVPGLLQHIRLRSGSSGQIAARVLARARSYRAAGRSMPSPRQMDVLRYLADGHSHRAIADALGISQATVDRHVADLYVKLDVASREQAIARAAELAWLPPRGQLG